MKKHQNSQMPPQYSDLLQRIALLELQLENERKMVEATKANNELLKASLNLYRTLHGRAEKQHHPQKQQWQLFDN